MRPSTFRVIQQLSLALMPNLISEEISFTGLVFLTAAFAFGLAVTVPAAGRGTLLPRFEKMAFPALIRPINKNAPANTIMITRLIFLFGRSDLILRRASFKNDLDS